MKYSPEELLKELKNRPLEFDIDIDDCIRYIDIYLSIGGKGKIEDIADFVENMSIY